MQLRIRLLIFMRLTVERDNLMWLCGSRIPYTWPQVVEGSFFMLLDYRADKEKHRGGACLGYTYVLQKPVLWSQTVFLPQNTLLPLLCLFHKMILQPLSWTWFIAPGIIKWRKLFINTISQKPFMYLRKKNYNHCVKSVRIWSFSGLRFPAFGMNTERYSAKKFQS